MPTPLLVGEIAASGSLQKLVRQSVAMAESAGVHGGFDQGAGGGRGMAVAGEQFRCAIRAATPSDGRPTDHIEGALSRHGAFLARI